LENLRRAKLFETGFIDRLHTNPRISPLFGDPTFLSLLSDLESNPESGVKRYVTDPRLNTILQTL
jgi:hypothetical protein